MNIFRKSIMLKLWLAMVTLVLIILYFAGTLQTSKLKELYYRQQTEQLTKEARQIAAHAFKINGKHDSEFLSAMASALEANIMITDADGYIQDCLGMGMDMRNVTEARISVIEHHGMPWKHTDLKQLRQGKAIAYRGSYHFLDSEVLSVAVPLYLENKVAGAIMLSAPLAPVESRISELQKITQFAGLGGIILATFLSLLFSRSMSQPLLRMNQVAWAMIRGDYSRRVNVKSRDEIGLLAETMNSLASELQEKIDTLERFDRTRQDFVANVSHELRTPLSIMQGYTEALIDGMAGSEEDRRKYLSNIHDEILRLRRLVAELLDLKKIKTGRVEMNMKEISLADIIQRVTEKFNPLAEEKKVKINTDIPIMLPRVRVDPDRMEQVLINLLDNALRATPSGGEIKVIMKEQKEMILVSISDTGPGIPTEELPLIWDRFYKVDKSRTRSGGGTGLGLAIVREIIEAHGGSTQVKSHPGKGSIFSFSVPIF